MVAIGVDADLDAQSPSLQHVELTHKACSSTLEAMRLWGLVFYPVVQFVAWCCLTIAEIVMPLVRTEIASLCIASTKDSGSVEVSALPTASSVLRPFPYVLPRCFP